MLGLIAALYSLLALGVHIRLEAAVWDDQGSLSVQISAAAFQLRSDAEIGWKQGRLRIVRRSKRRREKRTQRQGGRLAFRLLKTAMRRGWMKRLHLHGRIGLEDACATALAAGAIRALAAAMLRKPHSSGIQEICIEPDYECACLRGYVFCIFSCPLGDIMLAVLKAAVSKSGKKPGKRDSGGKASH